MTSLMTFPIVLGLLLVSMAVYAIRGPKLDADQKKKSGQVFLGAGDFLLPWFLVAVGPVADRMPGVVGVAMDVEPVDRQPGNLVEPRQRLGDLGAAEQLGERVRIIFVGTERDLLRGAILGIREGDQIAVTGAVTDDADLAAVVRDEGVQHADTRELHASHIGHAHHFTLGGHPSPA